MKASFKANNNGKTEKVDGLDSTLEMGTLTRFGETFAEFKISYTVSLALCQGSRIRLEKTGFVTLVFAEILLWIYPTLDLKFFTGWIVSKTNRESYKVIAENVGKVSRARRSL